MNIYIADRMHDVYRRQLAKFYHRVVFSGHKIAVQCDLCLLLLFMSLLLFCKVLIFLILWVDAPHKIMGQYNEVGMKDCVV